ncbi:MAG TPA: aminotransferase [Flavobacteriales bacterium]|nr:aminotransferase [Flavobacteriales bacterium]
MPNLTRKEFLKQSLLASASLPLLSSVSEVVARPLLIPSESSGLTTNEVFWANVRQQFSVNPEVVNLNNGAVGPQSIVVQQSHIKMYEESNAAPSHFMWRDVDGKREKLRAELANLLHCDKEELAINRNTTEGLGTVIFGIQLEAGDEVVVSDFDYPFMLNQWKQRSERDGIVLRQVQLPLPIEDNNEVVDLYRKVITSNTKVVHLTHVINWTGQIMPVKEITKMAQGLGCEVIVDAAHSLAHIPFSFKEIGCDYMATSLHKWLGAPFGTGALAIKKNKISSVWPLLSSWEPKSGDIRKLELLGTRSFPAEMAVLDAITFHQNIGLDTINNRFNYLKNHWAEQVKTLKGFKFHTSLKSDFSGAMATFSIDGLKAQEIADFLFDTDGLHVGVVDWNGLNGIRISPHLYTSLDELDRLALALIKLLNR